MPRQHRERLLSGSFSFSLELRMPLWGRARGELVESSHVTAASANGVRTVGYTVQSTGRRSRLVHNFYKSETRLA